MRGSEEVGPMEREVYVEIPMLEVDEELQAGG